MDNPKTQTSPEEIKLAHSILNESPVVGFIWKNEATWPVSFVTHNVLKIFGYSAEEFTSGRVSYEQIVHPDDLPRVIGEVAEAGADLNRVEFEHPPYRVLTKNGEVIWVSDRTTIERDVDRNIICYKGVVHDVTDQIEHNREIQESEEKFRNLFQNSHDGIFIHDLDGHIFDVNQKTLDIFGYSKNQMLSMHIKDLHPVEELKKSKINFEKIQKDKFVNFEIIFKRNNGQKFYADVSSSLFNLGGRQVVQGIVRDVTDKVNDQEEKRELELKLLHAQKMEALGTLAGGIAHDFNNLLMGIQGWASLMEIDIDPEHPFKRHLSGIEEHITSATGLTKQLLGLARGGKYQVKPTNLNRLIRASSELFGRTRKEIEIHLELEEPIPAILVDRGQIEQILLNIFVNAWQAMPGGGRLSIKTRCVMLDADFCAPYQALPGEYVRTSIADTGSGIEAAILPKIFDPFFSTKEKSRGTGLGLASAYGIVKNHNGIILVSSEPGHGATFDIFLPTSREEAASVAPTDKALSTGAEHILLIDDERYILEVTSSMLVRLGYRVVSVASGEEALAIIADQKDSFDLVILDLIMPGMDGHRTFELIREIAPEIKVLLASGYAIDGQAEQVLKKGCRGFIQKPFHIHEISKKIRSILDDRS